MKQAIRDYIAFGIIISVSIALGVMGTLQFVPPKQVVETYYVEVIKEVPIEVEVVRKKTIILDRIIYKVKELKDFRSTTEFFDLMKKYSDGVTWLGGNSWEQARIFASLLQDDGYYVFPSYLLWTKHFGVAGYVKSNTQEAIVFWDVTYKRAWTVHIWEDKAYWPLDISGIGGTIVSDSEPSWGKGGKPKKPKK